MGAVRVIRNAHHILGMGTGSTLSQVRQRAKHLLSLIKIDEVEEYADDLLKAKDLRSEVAIKDALEKLTSVKSRLVETFFWFEISSIQDQKAYKLVASSMFDEAYNAWSSEGATGHNWLSKKNSALALYIGAMMTGDLSKFERCLTVWRDILHSEQFWSFYKQNYSMSDDIGTSDDLFVEFRTQLPEYLSWLALDLYRKTNSSEVPKVFFAQIGWVGRGIEDHILAPVVTRLKADLASLTVDESAGESEAARVRGVASSLVAKLAQLSSLGMDEYSPVKVLREECAQRLRAASIAVFNHFDDISIAKELVDIGGAISQSESHLLQLDRDRAHLEKNEVFNQFMKVLGEKIKDRNHIDKLKVFKELEAGLPESLRSNEQVILIKQNLIVDFASEEIRIGRSYLDSKMEDKAIERFKGAGKEIILNIDIFALNKEPVLSHCAKILSDIQAISSPEQVSIADAHLDGVREAAEEMKIDDNSKIALVLLVHSTIWGAIAPYFKRLRYGSNLVRIGNCTWFLYGIGVLFWIAGFCYKRKIL